MKNTVILSWGCGPPTGHAPRLAKQLECEYYSLPSPIIPYEDNIIFVGCFIGDIVKLSELYNYGGYNIYTILVGTDVMELTSRANDDEVLKILRDVNVITVADHLKEELKQIGIESEVITLVPDEELDIELDEERNGILFYCPPNRFKVDLFYASNVIEVARALPNYNFYCYGGAELISDLPNWYNIGFVSGEEKKELYKKIKYNLRPSKHDGFPQSLIELARIGIPTITTHNYPQSIKVDDTNYLTQNIINKIVDDSFDVDTMINYYKNNFNPEDMVNRFMEVIGNE